MLRTGSRHRALATWTAGLLLTGALGACNGNGAPGPSPSDSGSDALAEPPAALPLSTSTPATLASAPPVTALPAGQAVRLVQPSDRREGYGYLDRAYYQEGAVEDAPPDYSFDDGGVRPWTWASGDGGRVISEPVAGGYRTYYYSDGSDTPYLVRDPQYSYAYNNGALAAVFTLAGVLVDPNAASGQMAYAGRYLDRGHALWQNATSGPHVAVNAYAWSDRRADLSAQHVAWQRHIADNPDWAAWNGAHQAQEQAPWTDVRVQHQQAAQQFGTWQQQHFQGPPPQLYAAPGAPPPAPEHRDHTAAVVGGVVAAGIAAGAVHAVAGQHGAPHQTMGPAAVPQAAQHHDGAHPVPPAAPTHSAQSAHVAPVHVAQPQRVAQPAHVAQPQRVARPVHVAQPQRVAQPAHVAQPQRVAQPVHVAQPQRVAQPAHVAPHAAPHPAPQQHQAPQPGPHEHNHGPQ